ncbi:MAG: S-layer homology domain-containing protein [Eubacteriales bacterium]|nr:S-layer homology domain-containing protein [Clostridiales bacterium]
MPYYLDSDGNKVFVGFAAKGKYVVRKDVVVSVMQNKKNLTDISGHWAEGYIDFVAEREIFLGTGGGIFAPKESATRAEVAAIIQRFVEFVFS